MVQQSKMYGLTALRLVDETWRLSDLQCHDIHIAFQALFRFQLTAGISATELKPSAKLLIFVTVCFHCVFRISGEETWTGGTHTPNQPCRPWGGLHPEGPQPAAGHTTACTLKVSWLYHDGIRQLWDAYTLLDNHLVTCGPFGMTVILWRVAHPGDSHLMTCGSSRLDISWLSAHPGDSHLKACGSSGMTDLLNHISDGSSPTATLDSSLA